MANNTTQYDALAEPLPIPYNPTPDKWMPDLGTPQQSWLFLAKQSTAAQVPGVIPPEAPIVTTPPIPRVVYDLVRLPTPPAYYLGGTVAPVIVIPPAPPVTAYTDLPVLPVPLPPSRVHAYPSIAYPLSESPETPTLSKWFKEVGRPLWDIPRTQYLHPPLTEPVLQPVPLVTTWYRGTEVPRWDVPRLQHLYPFDAVHPISTTYAERVTPDKWNQPWPMRPEDKPARPYLLPAEALYLIPTGPSVLPVGPISMQSIPTPGRPALPHLYPYQSVGPVSPPAAEVITLNKWQGYQPNQVRDIPRLQYLSAVPLNDPMPIAGSTGKFVDAWYQNTNLPVWDVRRQQFFSQVYGQPAMPTFPERITVDKWVNQPPSYIYQVPNTGAYLALPSTRVPFLPSPALTWQVPTSLPTRLAPSTVHLYPVSAKMNTPSFIPPVVLIDRWFVRASEPVFTKQVWLYTLPAYTERTTRYIPPRTAPHISGTITLGLVVSGSIRLHPVTGTIQVKGGGVVSGKLNA